MESDWKQRFERELAAREAAEELAEDRRLAIHRIEVQMRALELEVERLATSPSEPPARNTDTAEIVGAMSHALRTPLNAVIGYSEMLAEEASSAEAAADLRKITTSGRWLLAQINDMVDLARLHAGRLVVAPTEVRIPAVVQAVHQDLEHSLATSGCELELLLDPHLSERPVLIDAGKLATLLRHGIAVAAEHAEGSVRLGLSHEAGQLRVHIRTPGAHLEPDQIAALLDPRRPGRRHALGLSLARGLAELLGGALEVHSEPERGAEITAHLPAERLAAPQLAHHLDPDGARVLIIDDDPAVHSSFRYHLEQAGYEVFTASDGGAGLELARSLQPDAILLDLIMPGLSGWSVLTALQADPTTSAIPVILCSYVDNDSRGFSLGASDFLSKPIRRGPLLQSLARFRAPDSPTVLVVEDDAATRDLMARVLERAGWRVHTASNGREGLTRLSECQPDAIVLDLMMPVMNGFDFLERLEATERWSDVPVVVVTAMDLDEVAQRGIDRTVIEVLQKGSYTGKDLLGELQRRILRARHRSG